MGQPGVLRTRHDLLSSVFSRISQRARKNASELESTAGEISDSSVAKIQRCCATELTDL